MPAIKHPLVPLVDAAFRTAALVKESGLRTHLGASVLGEKCLRKLWFGFHWADKEDFDGRMLRLFARGQREEDVFVSLLELVGARVWTIHPTSKKQFRVSWFGGHIGGSTDGVATGIPFGAAVPYVLEMKTHNTKQFQKLTKEGVASSHPKHVRQAQIYMHGLNLSRCLYCAVNKDTDELYFEEIESNPDVALSLLDRGRMVVFSKGTGGLPPRISQTPAYFECRFCAFSGVCFGTKMPLVNCRTCVHSRATEDGRWECSRGAIDIDANPQAGCPDHVFAPELFPHATLVSRAEDGTSFTYVRRGEHFTNGQGGEPSAFFDLC
jgi:hypothetical protein